MSLRLEKVDTEVARVPHDVPEDELQKQLEQLEISNNGIDNENHVREGEGGEPIHREEEKGQDYKQSLKDDDNNNTRSEKKWNDCYSEDGIHEIEPTVTNNNDDKDVSSDDGSDISLPKHRKYYPSDDERSDSESFSNEYEAGSEDTGFHLTSPRRFSSPSEVYPPYEQITPIKFSNTHLQINDMNVPLEISPMSLGNGSSQDDIHVASVVNPIIRCIADLKSEVRTQLTKLHYNVDPNPNPNLNLHTTKVGEDWQHTEFEKSQDQCQYDALVTAGKLLDVIIPMQLPEEAKRCLAQARNILWEKSMTYRASSSVENATLPSIPQEVDDVDPENAVSLDVNNDKSSVQEEDDQTITTKVGESISTVVDGTNVMNNESSKNHDSITSSKYRRGSNIERKSSYRSTRGVTSYPGRRNQNYKRTSAIDVSATIKPSSPRAPNVRSTRSTASSSIAGSANNRRFVGFLSSRCFTCGGIGHYANDCPSEGSYANTSTKNQPPFRRRRSNGTNRSRRTSEFNATSND